MNKYSSPVPAFKGRAAYLKALAEHPRNAKMITRARAFRRGVAVLRSWLRSKNARRRHLVARARLPHAARQGERPGQGCHAQFKRLHRVIWLLMLMPAAQLCSFYFSPPSLWSRGWLLTSAATHGNRGCCFQTNVSAIISPPAIFRRGGKKSCSSSLEGMIYSHLCWFLHENQVVVLQCCQIYNDYCI